MIARMNQTPNLPPAGWYSDPAGGGGERFWDGQAWSQSTRDSRPEPNHPAQNPQSPYGGPSYQPYQREQQAQPLPGQWQQNSSYQPYQRQRLVPAQGNYRIAEFWPRALGFVLDSVILYGMNTIMNLLFAGESSAIFQSYIERVMLAMIYEGPMPSLPTEALVRMSLLSLLSVVMFAAYRSIMLGTKSATVGQMIMGFRTVKLGDETNANLGWRDAIVRGVVGAVLYNLIPIFMQVTALVTSRRQTVPDLLSKTIVINTREASS